MSNKSHYDDAFDYPELSTMSDRDFYRTYKNFMHSIAKQEGLDDGQAALAVDDVLITIFMKHACHFNPRKNRFSNYLATMVRNACRSLKRKERRYVGTDEEALARLCEKRGSFVCRSAYAPGEIMGLVQEGINILRKEVRSQLMVDAFVMQLIDEERPKDIALMLNVRPDYVSLAKNHCLPRLRAIVKTLMAK